MLEEKRDILVDKYKKREQYSFPSQPCSGVYKKMIYIETQ